MDETALQQASSKALLDSGEEPWSAVCDHEQRWTKTAGL